MFPVSQRAKPHLNFVISLVSIVPSSWETLLPALSARIRSAVYAKATLCPIHMLRHVSPFLYVRRPDRARDSFLFPPRVYLPQFRSLHESPFLSRGYAQEIENSNAGIMGRFRLETSSGNSPSAGYCTAAD